MAVYHSYLLAIRWTLTYGHAESVSQRDKPLSNRQYLNSDSSVNIIYKHTSTTEIVKQRFKRLCGPQARARASRVPVQLFGCRHEFVMLVATVSRLLLVHVLRLEHDVADKVVGRKTAAPRPCNRRLCY